MKIREYGVVENGVDKSGLVIAFDDGSQLLVCAKVRLPPEEELTPQETIVFDLQSGARLVRQSVYPEAFQLSEASTAFQTLRRIEAILFGE